MQDLVRANVWGERWEQEEDFELAIQKEVVVEDHWGEPGYLEAIAAETQLIQHQEDGAGEAEDLEEYQPHQWIPL